MEVKKYNIATVYEAGNVCKKDDTFPAFLMCA